MGRNEGKMSQLGEGLSDCSSEVARAIGRICERREWSDLHTLLSQYFDSNFKCGMRERVKESFSMNGASKHQLCLCLKAGIDASLDVNRSVYLQAVDDTVQLIQEYQQQCRDGREGSNADTFDLKMMNTVSRGYYLVVASKNRGLLSEWVNDVCFPLAISSIWGRKKARRSRSAHRI